MRTEKRTCGKGLKSKKIFIDYWLVVEAQLQTNKDTLETVHAQNSRGIYNNEYIGQFFENILNFSEWDRFNKDIDVTQ